MMASHSAEQQHSGSDDGEDHSLLRPSTHSAAAVTASSSPPSSCSPQTQEAASAASLSSHDDIASGDSWFVAMLTKLATSERKKKKYHIRAICQSLAFVALVGSYTVYNVYDSFMMSPEDAAMDRHRRLEAQDLCSDIEKADPKWLTVFYSIGVLYMFLALAIVCDEFFVPALEEMSSSRRMNLSMDVAGATLMAAGGSAPELFTSLFGTFRESEVGFGTIVGSAVFNVLFVIAACSLMAKETLQLTWWPLFRDSSYYAVGLAVLSVFTGVVSPNEIEMWEAIVLFVMYIGYILFMWKNADIYKAITGKELEYPDSDEDGDGDGGKEESHPEGERPKLTRAGSKESVLSGIENDGVITTNGTGIKQLASAHFRWQGTFRAGILKLLRDPESWIETAGVGIVARISGDADHIFQQVDMDGNGHIDREELKQLFNLLECFITPDELEEVFEQLDEDKDGTICQSEFTNWYVKSEERLLSQVHHIFDRIDENNSKTIDAGELKKLLHALDSAVSDEEVQKAMDEMYQHGSREEITFEEFSEWYKHSVVYERQLKRVEEDMEGVWESLMPPKEGSCLAWVQYLVVLPLVIVMTFTIPDVQRPGWGKYCYFSFVMSILWIGAFAYLMVTWAEIIGNTAGIPAVIMGLTVLAAGTSVPDLLSSVIVARRGSGDMAVSSSVGSNIFDILVGLPIPWILYTAWPSTGDVVEIASDNIFVSLFILLGMLVFVIAAVHCQGWKLTKTLGGLMLLFYAAFLVQAVVLELPFETCIDGTAAPTGSP
eukprot:CAMPEP_0119570372 /NCGR_PEP_ID=MMETSP1352-20130426/43579_1 /TAXON_ID=265584 /ORGANISM="Stauroneis constricta, Strain CCMP1120" /LENGTH=773 /DNA_ID=CAMNT_0007620039 /DNA_START=839 /DNA_END=3160 /DNA_ORIENTATION=+